MYMKLLQDLYPLSSKTPISPLRLPLLFHPEGTVNMLPCLATKEGQWTVCVSHLNCSGWFRHGHMSQAEWIRVPWDCSAGTYKYYPLRFGMCQTRRSVSSLAIFLTSWRSSCMKKAKQTGKPEKRSKSQSQCPTVSHMALIRIIL